jgi:putative DNA primase/helicase
MTEFIGKEDKKKVSQALPSQDTFKLNFDNNSVTNISNYINIKDFFKKEKKKTIFLAKDLSNEIIKRYNFFILNNKDYYYYDQGYYKKDSPKKIKLLISNILTSYYSNNNRINEVFIHIDLQGNKLKLKDLNIKKYNHLINLKNGVYDIKQNKLLKHDPKYFFTYQIPINYNEKSDCPKIKKYLSEVLNQDIHNLVYELFGYSLIQTNKYQKAFFLLGNGDNGKSVLINLLKEFIGDDNYSSVTFKNIDEHKFMIARMKNKLLNLCADISSQYIKETETFKNITGNDPVEIEEKGKEPETVTLFCKLIFSCNELPKTVDKSEGFLRRLIIIPFLKKIEEEKKDPDLIFKLTTKEELSGLLNLAIQGLHRLGNNKKFTETDSIKEIKIKYENDNDSIKAFINENYYINKENKNLKKDFSSFFYEFTNFCIENNYTKLGKIKFKEKLIRYYDLTIKNSTGNQVFIYGLTTEKPKEKNKNLKIIKSEIEVKDEEIFEIFQN